jgi:fructose/tagatose bisphosphate aldolase
MSLVTITSMLDCARKDQYAVGAFDVSNHDMALAVIEVAEEQRSPVILMGLGVDLTGGRLDYWLPGIRRMAERATVPVCIHLDHAADLEFIRHCVDMGFTSVMFDGSTLPLEENIRRTQAVTKYAHTFGVSVEAELGHVGDGIVGNSETGKVRRDVLTNRRISLPTRRSWRILSRLRRWTALRSLWVRHTGFTSMNLRLILSVWQSCSRQPRFLWSCMAGRVRRMI